MRHKHHHHHRRQKVDPIKVVLIILGSIIFVALVAGLSFWFLWNRSKKLNEETMFLPQEHTDIGEATPESTATPEPLPDAPAEYDLYENGTYYKLRTNVVTVLFMGVDSKTNKAADDGVAIGTGQTDALLLGVFDTENGGMRILHIPRDTQTDIKILDMQGQYVKTERSHLCLQHAYGDGGPLSCELTTDAVSNLLFGAPISRYVSMGTDGIVKAVDAIGGLELEMLDDFTFFSSGMKKGTVVKLNGKRAKAYISSRINKGLDGTDASRVNRQIQFLKAFVVKVKALAKSNPTIILTLYNAVKGYVQTDLSLDELLFLANQGLAVGFSEENLIRLPGTVGEETQPFFHMDDEAARAIVLELFYEEIPWN